MASGPFKSGMQMTTRAGRKPATIPFTEEILRGPCCPAEPLETWSTAGFEQAMSEMARTSAKRNRWFVFTSLPASTPAQRLPNHLSVRGTTPAVQILFALLRGELSMNTIPCDLQQLCNGESVHLNRAVSSTGSKTLPVAAEGELG